MVTAGPQQYLGIPTNVELLPRNFSCAFPDSQSGEGGTP